MRDTTGPSTNHPFDFDVFVKQRKVGDPLTLREVHYILRHDAKLLYAGSTVRAQGCRWTLVDPEDDSEDPAEVPGRLLILDQRLWEQMLATLERHLTDGE